MTAGKSWIEDTYKTLDGTETDHRLEQDAGIVDSKGRKVGSLAIVRPHSEWVFDVGSRPTGKFEVSVQSTRDGKIFGAITPHEVVDTLEQAKKLGEKKLAASIKRALKVHAAQ